MGQSVLNQWIHPQVKFWQRPLTILVYYTISLLLPVFMLYLTRVALLMPIGFSLKLAAFGFLGGILGGIACLANYSQWLTHQTKRKFSSKIGKMAWLNYVLPFRGWMLLFLFGLLAQGLFLGWSYSILEHETGLLSACSILAGMIQPAFVPYSRQDKAV